MDTVGPEKYTCTAHWSLNNVDQISIEISLDVVCWGYNWEVILCSGNGLVPNRHQAITWTNDDIINDVY